MLRDRFELEYEIGSGGMGSVFKGVDTQSGQPVAIKRLKPDLIKPAMLERFRREGEALLQLNHPNIVDFIDAFEDEGQHYLVLEYIDGTNLKDAIQQNRPDVPWTIDISLGIADALTRAHFLNILHRDIKPANILIGNDSGIYLTDFGVAAFGELSHLTETDGVVGSIPYLSPELLENRTFSEKSDIWAFGIVLYEMLTCARPFQDDHAGTLIRAILFDDVPDLEAITNGVPIALIDLIYRMLEKDPMFRIPSVRLVGVELEALKKGYVPYTPRQLKRDDPLTTIESRFTIQFRDCKALHNLPAALTPFVGRETELREIERLLTTERCISIVAAGGMGKTRLALQAANGQLGNWSDGVYFVDLAPITSPEAIPGKIAEATGLQFYEDVEPHDQILSYLREKQMLIILDNCEHLLKGVSMVSDILQTAPDVSIIATSREHLHLQGEMQFTISGMDFPDWETPEDALDYAAVKLFVQSAHRTNATFELREEDLKYIVLICRLLDGMPLGILLSAGWINLLTPEEIAVEISRNIDFLETDQRNVPDRQRSIRAVFDNSWGRLSQREQDILAAMSVFRGGFTREAAQVVTGAGLRDLMALVNKSIIARQPDGRYDMHQLMRQYAAEQLNRNSDIENAVREKHCHYYLNFMAERDYALKTAEQFVAMREIEPEIENVEAAWRYGVDHHYNEQLGAALEAVTNFHLYLTNYANLRNLLDYSIDKVTGILLGRMLTWSTFYLFDTQQAIANLNHALEILDQPGTPPGDLANILAAVGLLRLDETLFHRAEKIAMQSEDPWLKYTVLARWRVYNESKGDFQEAARVTHELIQKVQEMGNVIFLVEGYLVAALMEENLKNVDAAVEVNQKSIELARKVGLDSRLVFGLNNQAAMFAQQGRVDEAIDTVQEAIEISRRLGHQWWIWSSTDSYAQILFDLGKFEEARILFNQCYEIVFSEFPEQLQAKTLIINRLGFVELRLGKLEISKRHFIDALRYFSGVAIPDNFNRVNSLVGLAHVSYGEGDYLRTLKILSVVSQRPMPEGQDSYADEARDLTAKLEAELSPEEIEIARQQAETYDLEALIEELLAEYGAGN